MNNGTRIAYITGTGTTIRGTLAKQDRAAIWIRWDGFSKLSKYPHTHPIARGIQPA